ncbi:MAG: APC family permease [Acidobacteriota bacterium]
MSAADGVQDEGLVRAIGPVALALAIINTVVGGGIFVLPGLVAVELGSAAIIAYLICAVVVALVFLCFAEIGSRVSRSGGAYAYIEEAFGPFAGFVAAMLFWFGWCALSDAAIAVAMVETLALAFPLLGDPVARALFIVAVLTVLALVNIRGVRTGVRLVIFNTVAKLVPLLLLLVAGLFAVSADNLAIGAWPSLHNIGGAAIILFFAFAGAESPLAASGEIDNPSRTVPLGLLAGLGGILVLYVGLQTVAQGVLGAGLAFNTDAPLAAAATKVFGLWGATMLLIGGVVSIWGTLSGDLLSVPRVVFASARDENLPRFLARVHPRYRTPYTAVTFYAVVVGGFALSGTFKPLAVVASGSVLVLYGGVSLAVLEFRRRDGKPGPGELALPFGRAIPIASCLVVGWLLWQMSGSEMLGLVALIGASIALYGLRSALAGPRSRPR